MAPDAEVEVLITLGTPPPLLLIDDVDLTLLTDVPELLTFAAATGLSFVGSIAGTGGAWAWA